MYNNIVIPPNLMDAIWARLLPEVTEWLHEHDILYTLEECDDYGRMILTIPRDSDALAFKLWWL